MVGTETQSHIPTPLGLAQILQGDLNLCPQNVSTEEGGHWARTTPNSDPVSPVTPVTSSGHPLHLEHEGGEKAWDHSREKHSSIFIHRQGQAIVPEA
jgi:hypothetical protein